MVEEIKTCNGCNGACCRYVALEIDCPENLEDFDNIRWYIIHQNVRVYVEEDRIWNLEFLSPCKYLREDGRCNIHEDFVKNPSCRRPQICKDFTTLECPYHNKYKELFSFESVEEVDKYIEEIFNKGLHRIPEEDEEDED